MIKLILALFFACATQVAQAGTIRHIGGVIRCTDGASCDLIRRANHVPLGITSVAVDGDSILIRYPRSNGVITLVVGVDETLSQAGVVCGASVGLAHSAIKCNVPVVDLAVPGANIWISGMLLD